MDRLLAERARDPLPVEPPVIPMLGRLVRELPIGDFIYEPKWDGFRCVVFRNRDSIDLRSRNDRPLTRYFPELVSALASVEPSRFVLDGEILVRQADGYDFGALMMRLHPAASRVRQLSAAAPASIVAFDLLAVDDRDLREVPFSARRHALEAIVSPHGEAVRLTPATTDLEVAAAWLPGPAGASTV